MNYDQQMERASEIAAIIRQEFSEALRILREDDSSSFPDTEIRRFAEVAVVTTMAFDANKQDPLLVLFDQSPVNANLLPLNVPPELSIARQIAERNLIQANRVPTFAPKAA